MREVFWGERSHGRLFCLWVWVALQGEECSNLPEPFFLICEKAGRIDPPEQKMQLLPHARLSRTGLGAGVSGLNSSVSLVPPGGVLPGPTPSVCQGRDGGAQMLESKSRGLWGPWVPECRLPLRRVGRPPFWEGQAHLGNVWFVDMKSESIPKRSLWQFTRMSAICGEPSEALIHSFTQRAGTVYQVTDTELSPRATDMMETGLPFPPAASRAEGEEDVGQEVTQSWVKPLTGEEGFGHGGQERRLVMPKLRLARQRGRGKSVAGREMACTMLWGPEGRTQAKWSLGATWSGREEGRELGWLQRPCCLCERDWAAFRGWREGLEGLGQGR